MQSGKDRVKTKTTNKNFANLTAYFILIVAGASVAFFGVCNPDAFRPASLGGTAATVGSEKVSFQRFRRSYEMLSQQYSRLQGGKFDPGQMKLAETVLNQLVSEASTSLLARDLGFATARSEVEDILFENFVDEKTKEFNPTLLKNTMSNQGLSESDFLALVQNELTANRFRRFATDADFYATAFAEVDYQLAETKLAVDYLRLNTDGVKISVTAADVNEFLAGDGKKKVEDFYNANKSTYNKAAKVKASHILITHKDSRRPSGEGEKRSKEQAMVLAKSILAEVAKNDFAALAKKYTEDPSGKDKGGDLGFFERESMVKAFSDVAFTLKVGQTSDLVDSEFGYHIIKVTDTQAAVERSLESVQNDIAQDLIRKQRAPEVLTRRAEQLLAEVKAGKSVAPMLKEYDLSWQTTDSFALEARSIPTLGSDEALLAAAQSLKIAGEVYPSVLVVGDYRVIMRLNRRSSPGKAIPAESLNRIASDAVREFGGTLFRVTSESYQKKLNDAGKVYINPAFLAIDQPAAPQG